MAGRLMDWAERSTLARLTSRRRRGDLRAGPRASGHERQISSNRESRVQQIRSGQTTSRGSTRYSRSEGRQFERTLPESEHRTPQCQHCVRPSVSQQLSLEVAPSNRVASHRIASHRILSYLTTILYCIASYQENSECTSVS